MATQHPVLTLSGGVWRDQHGNRFDPANIYTPFVINDRDDPDDASGGDRGDRHADPEAGERDRDAGPDAVVSAEHGKAGQGVPRDSRDENADSDGDEASDLRE